MDKKIQALTDISKYLTENESIFDDSDFSLETGKCGLLLFYYYQYKFTGNVEFLEKARHYLEDIIDKLESDIEEFQPSFKTDSLSNYISSFGKTILFIEQELDDYFDFGDLYGTLHESLIEINEQNFVNEDFDINSGALSIGHYFINYYKRYKDAQSKSALISIVKAISKSAIKLNNDEIYWKAPRLNDAVYLGISHGSAMIINFLVKLFELKILCDEDKDELDILTKAVSFLFNQKRDFREGYFPILYQDKKGIAPTQFTMCYGDLGIGYALHTASKITKNTNIELISLEILNSCADRKLDTERTYDASIFYGASGLFILFDKLFRITGCKNFETAHDYWFHNILTYRTGDIGRYAGFKNMFDNHTVKINLSMGWGLIGIAIGLMVGLQKKLPKIDELTMIGI
jgi:lantibiotic modifying enzyme